MRTPRRGQGSSQRGYAVIGIFLLVCFGLFVLWPTDGSWGGEGGAGGDATKDKIIEALLAENTRLATSGGGGDAAAVAAPAAPCNCDSEMAHLQAEISRLKSKLRRTEDALTETESLRASDQAKCSSSGGSRAVIPTGGDSGRVVDNSAGQHLPVASCAKQKLEFLRWQKDANGNEKKCPFTPENYDNWTKLPPLCDYISIECLGTGNLRAAHIYGFGGPTLMIGYADVMMWEFVWARHTTQKDMVELGTMSGGTSLYWGLAARVRGGQFHTFDLNDNRHSTPKRGWLDNMHFHKRDILSNVICDEPSTHVSELVEVLDTGRPQIALFDNGNKKKETDCYCRYLAVGSVLLLHDWEHLDLPKPHWEMTLSYVKTELDKRGFRPAYFDFAEHIGSSTRAFIRVSEGPL